MTDMDYRRQSVISYLVALDDGELGALLAEARGEPTRDPKELILRELRRNPPPAEPAPPALNDEAAILRRALGG